MPSLLKPRNLKMAKKIADALGTDPETRRKAREARRELRENVRFSDFLLTMIMVGFAMASRYWVPRSPMELYACFGLVLLSFCGYLALKSHEEKRDRPLLKCVNTLD